jgi:uncharacterized protein (DUF779 family)
MSVDRVIATPAGLALIEQLKFEARPPPDVLPVRRLLRQQCAELLHISKSQFEFWQHTQVIVDVIDCDGGGTFSLEGGSGKAFLSRSRLFTDDEWAELEKTPPLTGDVQQLSSDQ